MTSLLHQRSGYLQQEVKLKHFLFLFPVAVQPKKDYNKENHQLKSVAVEAVKLQTIEDLAMACPKKQKLMAEIHREYPYWVLINVQW